MRLIGSKTEQDIRKQLIASNKSIFQEGDNLRLRVALQGEFPNMKTAYVLNWIPEQGEDIYKVLVDNFIVAEVELDRVNPSTKPIVNSIPISQYQIGLSKLNQIKLAVAIELAEKDKGSVN